MLHLYVRWSRRFGRPTTLLSAEALRSPGLSRLATFRSLSEALAAFASTESAFAADVELEALVLRAFLTREHGRSRAPL
jgi:hypothetical protein